MYVLDDGDYDVIVVDAHEVDDDNDTSLRIELTVTAGARKGETVVLYARNLQRDSVSILGLPGTLSVRDGTPTLSIE